MQYPPLVAGLPTSVTVLENQSSNILYTVYDPLASNFTITAISSNTNIITVSNTGTNGSYTLNIAGALNMTTVAEGVETQADFLTVREMGFHRAQGYYLGKPASVKKFARSTLGRHVSLPQ